MILEGGWMMNRIGVRLLATAAAVMMIMLLVPMAVGSFSYADYEEKYLDHFTFNGDDEQWGHIYVVDSSEGTLTYDQLNIRILDDQGDEVPLDKCDISIERNWWDGEEEQYEDVDLTRPIGISERDKKENEGEGFTQFVISAEAKEDSGYEDSIDAEFFIAEKNTLYYVCSDIDFPDNTWGGDWRMHYRFKVQQSKLTHPVVKSVTGELLEKDKDYTVEYYELGGPLPEGDEMADWNELFSTDKPAELDENGVPAHNGQYFARIRGIEPFYGGNDVILEVGDFIVFDEHEEGDLWSDSNKTYTLDLPEGIDGDLWIGVGKRNDDGWNILFSDTEDESDYFVYDKDTQELTLKGAGISQVINDDGLDLYACIHDKDWNIFAEGFSWTWVNDAECDYDLPESDDYLPDWGVDIQNRIHVFIRNAKYPDGKDEELVVTDAEIVSQDPDEEGKKVLSDLEEKEDGSGWWCSTENYGLAVIRIHFIDLDGGEETYSFEVLVSDTIYRTDIWAEDGRYKGLPGDTINLRAWAQKEFMNDNGDHDWTTDGLRIHWKIIYGDDFADISVDEEDQTKATVTFRDMPEDWDSGEEILIREWVTDDDSDDPSAECRASEVRVWMCTVYHQVEPAMIDPNLGIGESIVIEPKMMRYERGKDPVEIEEAEFQVMDYSEEELDVKELDDGEKFRITRKGEWDFNFRIVAEWSDEEDDYWSECWYHMNRFDTDIWFDPDETMVHDDYHKTLDLNLDSLGDFKNYTIDYKVGYFDEADNFIQISPQSGIYTVDDGKVTIYGEQLKTAGYGGVNVNAKLIIDGKEYNDTWCWVELAEACKEHRWFTLVTKEPTCTETGLKDILCGNCYELRTGIEVPALGHKLDHVEQKPATDKEEGVLEHWKCERCGECYSDAEGKNKIAEAETVIPVNDITVKANKVTAKANKNTNIKANKAFTVTNPKGKVTYKKTKGDKKITVSKAGKVTVKKGLKKGKTYSVKVKVTSAATAQYAAYTRTVTLKVKIK